MLEEKFVERTVYAGHLTAVSELEATIESGQTVAPLCNLKITIEPAPGVNPGGELYGKALESSNGQPCQTRIRFTSVSPELKRWVQCGKDFKNQVDSWDEQGVK